MLEMAPEIKIDLNATDNYKRTGFIWACDYKRSQVIDQILAKAESLLIDLQVKDDDGQSGYDYFPEHFGGSSVHLDTHLTYGSYVYFS